jgi:DNA-binding transcriptional regulator YbjK
LQVWQWVGHLQRSGLQAVTWAGLVALFASVLAVVAAVSRFISSMDAQARAMQVLAARMEAQKEGAQQAQKELLANLEAQKQELLSKQEAQKQELLAKLEAQTSKQEAQKQELLSKLDTLFQNTYEKRLDKLEARRSWLG